MRVLLVVVIVVAAMGLAPRRSSAQNYPWCAYYGGMGGGGTNCGFTTFQQCLATLSGIGGSCDPNTQYVPPPGPHGPVYRRHRMHSAND